MGRGKLLFDAVEAESFNQLFGSLGSLRQFGEQLKIKLFRSFNSNNQSKQSKKISWKITQNIVNSRPQISRLSARQKISAPLSEDEKENIFLLLVLAHFTSTIKLISSEKIELEFR